MAGDRQRQRIGGTRPGDPPGRFGRTDTPGDFQVARRVPHRNLTQRLPDPLLKCGTAQIERQVEPKLRCVDKPHHLGYPTLEPGIPPDQGSFREAILKITRELIRIVAQQDGADTDLAGGDQDGSQRALSEGKAYFGVGTAGAVIGRRHAERLVGALVEAPDGIVPGLIDRLGNRKASIKLRPDTLHRVRRRKRLGGQACHRLENTVQMVRAHFGMLSQICQGGYLLGVLDQPAHFGDKGGMLLGQRRVIRFATFAGAIACLRRIVGSRMKPHVFRPGVARAAGGATVDTRRHDGVEKCAVRFGIAGDDGRPARVAQGRGGKKFGAFRHIGFLSTVSIRQSDAGSLPVMNKYCTPSLAFELPAFTSLRLKPKKRADARLGYTGSSTENSAPSGVLRTESLPPMLFSMIILDI